MTDKRTFREALPDDINELKDIIEVQLARIREQDTQLRAYTGNSFTQIDFTKPRPPPKDWEDEY
tara:strand:- start:242 stop:433 length:192 start_codon:yes stop_codon:yes gene_type:complete